MSKDPALNTLNTKAFEIFDEALKQFEGPTTVNMFEWIAKKIMLATDTVYRPLNRS